MSFLKTLAMFAHYCLWVNAQYNGSFLVDTTLTRVTNKFLSIMHMDMVSIPKVFIYKFLIILVSITYGTFSN
jgi:hypothetical protein